MLQKVNRGQTVDGQRSDPRLKNRDNGHEEVEDANGTMSVDALKMEHR
jgi:hypothetical protein